MWIGLPREVALDRETLKMETVVILSVSLLGIPFVEGAKSASSSSGSPRTASSSSSTSFGEMEVTDYLRSGAFVVAFLATAFAGKDTWMLTDTIMCASFGAIWYFFPKPLLEYQVISYFMSSESRDCV